MGLGESPIDSPSGTANSTSTASEHTAGQRAVAALVIGSASALTVGVFAWAAWVAGQIAIPV